MNQTGANLGQQIADLLAEVSYREHPLYTPLNQVWQQYQDLARRIERISKISDSYQSIAKERELSLADKIDKQLRQLEKLARISDRYQQIMRDLNTALKQASTQDELTGIANRRLLLERLKQEYSRSQRDGQPLTLVMLDLDYFKRVNDAHGHDIGDKVLVETARVIQEQLRTHDLCGRWGGEEFLFILPNTVLTAGAQVMERVLSSIRQMKIRLNNESLEITASAGVARQLPAENYSDTINRADRALLQAKRNGRDRLQCSD